MDGKLLALMTAISFGLNPVVLKMGMARTGRADAAVIIGLGVAIPIYAALLPLVGGLHWEQVSLAALVGFVLGGLFGGGIGRRWLYTAIDRIGASPATAIKNSAPLLTTALAIVLFSEPVGLTHWLATILIIGGIVLVTWKSGRRFSMVDAGVLAAVGAAISYGIRPLFLKFGLDEANVPLTAALVGAIAAFVWVVLMSRVWSPGSGVQLSRAGLGDRALTAFLAAGVLQAVGFLSLTFALAGNDVSVVYPVTSTAPLFTVGFTWLLLRGTEQVGWRMVAGVIAVVAGVVML